jgi:hypothetical protein
LADRPDFSYLDAGEFSYKRRDGSDLPQEPHNSAPNPSFYSPNPSSLGEPFPHKPHRSPQILHNTEDKPLILKAYPALNLESLNLELL